MFGVLERSLTKNIRCATFVSNEKYVQRGRDETEHQAHLHVSAVFRELNMCCEERTIERYGRDDRGNIRQKSVERMLRKLNEWRWAKL